MSNDTVVVLPNKETVVVQGLTETIVVEAPEINVITIEETSSVLKEGSNVSTIVQEVTDTVVVGAPNTHVIVSGAMGPTGISEISKAYDFDDSTLTDRSLIRYNSAQGKWLPTNVIDGGTY